MELTFLQVEIEHIFMYSSEAKQADFAEVSQSSLSRLCDCALEQTHYYHGEYGNAFCSQNQPDHRKS